MSTVSDANVDTAKDASSVTSAEEKPVTKKQKTSESKEEGEKKTPFDIKFEAINKVAKELKCGYMVVHSMTGLGKDYNEKPVEEKKKIHARLTQKNVDAFKIIFVTKRRENDWEEMKKVVLGDQYGGSFLSFTTSFSYQIIEAYEEFKIRYQQAKDPSIKFNYLFGFTQCLEDYDSWMTDHEGGWGSEFGGQEMLTGVGRMWKDQFKKVARDRLCLDEFSEMGVKEWLKNFKKTVTSIDTYDDPRLKFNWG
mmetsp:Transcript_258/g.575  ORF Transcript_258/g.575 Transcript_258/m.575 type:complete len:251 (-) Transcript_258:402-1154(-)|eukprot:CAMPEP_0113310986 /NCGR_PEP_ID=MMETSP0010_2-20120614/8409_1 /TAXON_ID=216773 ORGANISM="Corethron hystrix, Strain 308" /NCGR_SAMPLE_ID=MMETSP0010_2 /ASSEMBLY_ACC=CAM_ASM_000155 /LENGTH=250 /DNA_ID=CAMNT_0000166545 /DNA_START=237 /DNA_END=989 /DNA_ORIENTATION=+ /assembly_acc=CAM_ASM_000155